MISTCDAKEDEKLCKCLDESIFKGFTYDEYKVLDKNSTDYKEFMDDAKEECQDEGWF